MLPLKLLTSMYNFNPHPRVEGDKLRDTLEQLANEFQSTPSRGG